MPIQILVEMRFGSHLYGTSTPASDLDIKGVHIPAAREILLQSVSPVLLEGRAKQPGERNTAADLDREIFSLQRYLELLMEGQTLALDMLFAPDWAMLRPPSAVWREVRDLGPRLVTRRATAFVRYCRQQANKYGIKGSRVAACRRVLAILDEIMAGHGGTRRLGEVADPLLALVGTNDFITLVEMPSPGGRLIRHLDVCGRKLPFTASVKSARDVIAKLVSDYGQRALAAERSEGVDWKALSHAVRVGHEALELFNTGRITFPRPEADLLLDIKLGRLSYPGVAAEIERLLDEVEEAAARADLPEEPDREAADALVLRAYRRRVLEEEASNG